MWVVLGWVVSKFFHLCVGLGWVSQLMGWVGSSHTKWTRGQLWDTWFVTVAWRGIAICMYACLWVSVSPRRHREHISETARRISTKFLCMLPTAVARSSFRGTALYAMYTHPSSTQPCIPPGSLNRVPASAGVRAGISPLSGGR